MRQDQGRRDRRGRGAITIVLLALAALLPGTALAAPPAPSFTASPVPARIGQPVTLIANVPGLGGGTLTWDFGDGTAPLTGGGEVAVTQHTYDALGSRTVTLTVARPDAEPQVVAGTFDVLGPQAAFTLSTVTPNVGDAVAFDATASSDPQGGLSGYAWDFGDGTTADGVAPTHVYATPGERTVTLTTTSALDGRTATTTQTLRVNGLPVAGFGIAPASPRTGDVVTLTSSATDPDGPADIATVAWDLDDDGAFDDPGGATAQVAFLTAGDYTVSQRVTDRNGATATAFRTITVTGAPTTGADPTPGDRVDGDGAAPVVVPAPGEPAVPATTTGTSGSSTTPVTGTGTADSTSTGGVRRLRALTSVRVRLAGTVTAGLTSLTSLTVVGPKGTTFRARCLGRGCGVKPLRVRLARKGSRRLAPLQRTYRAGLRLQVDATKAGYLPKRVVLTFRNGAPPARKEQCLWPGARKGQTRAAACPSG